MSDQDDDKKIGYGNPPKKYRFKKGQSGNPKGRPKRVEKTDREQFRDAVDERIGARVGGRHVTVSKLKAMFIQQVNKAVAGDTRAYREIMKQLGQPKVFPQFPCIEVEFIDPADVKGNEETGPSRKKQKGKRKGKD